MITRCETCNKAFWQPDHLDYATNEEYQAAYQEWERETREHVCDDRVPESCKCPQCGEDRVDMLEWQPEDEIYGPELYCATCGWLYSITMPRTFRYDDLMDLWDMATSPEFGAYLLGMAHAEAGIC
jgi:rubredoxin